MKTKFFILTFLTLVVISCGNNEGNTSAVSAEDREDNSAITQKNERYQDSLSKVSQVMNDLAEKKMTTEEAVSKLTKSRDSLQSKLTTIENSIADIKDKKLENNIEVVTSKLAEIKQEKENLVEQTELKKEEAQLATSKVEILEKEKAVYANQKQSLFEKGAAPEAFTEVEATLEKINAQISAKKDEITKLNRKVSDNALAIKRLDNYRTTLSENIRKSYDAEKILNEYNKEEAARLQELILSYNAEIDQLANEASSLSSDYKTLEAKTSNLKQQVVHTQEEESSSAKAKSTSASSTGEEGSLNTALLVVLILFLIMVFLYRLGKKRKKAKQLK